MEDGAGVSHMGLNRAHGVLRGGRKMSSHHRVSQSEPMPLEEAAKIEMQSLPSKTPVSVLQELLSRRGTTPKYELVQVEGAIHEPTFRYRVTVAEAVALGTGRSKKEAKHAAAKAVLDRLIGNGDGNILGSNTSSVNEATLKEDPKDVEELLTIPLEEDGSITQGHSM
ncbi:hypothetical protein AAG570_009551 [Ranatra chinensis]|uniref:DRBM domain-containing protein n=1 Tax=Ranatra chinensis TaxID=642074 RepID=A0ABD0YPE7_9HEMI